MANRAHKTEIAKVFLKSGSIVTVSEDDTEYNIKQAAEFFNAVNDKLKLLAADTEADKGYMQYCGYTIRMDAIEAIVLSDDITNYIKSNLRSKVETKK